MKTIQVMIGMILGMETMEIVQLTRMSRLESGHGLVSSFPFTMISGSIGLGLGRKKI
jgi:hypothetical protein